MGRRRKLAQLRITKISCGLMLLLAISGCTASFEAKPLQPSEFKQLIESSKAVQVIDVRTPGEFSTGYLPNAVNIDFFNEAFQSELDKLDRNKPIAVYCTVGQRSGKAYDMLVEMKFRRVYHLEGGLNAWQAAGL